MNCVYIENYIEKDKADALYELIIQYKGWEQRDAPRKELYFALYDVPYTYGRGRGIRTYHPEIGYPIWMTRLWHEISETCKTSFDACFLNRYDNQYEHIGWHSDNADILDDYSPIAIYSVGYTRIFKTRLLNGDDEKEYELQHNSVLIMPPHFQETHQHKIIKPGRYQDISRVSFTFRKLKYDN